MIALMIASLAIVAVLLYTLSVLILRTALRSKERMP